MIVKLKILVKEKNKEKFIEALEEGIIHSSLTSEECTKIIEKIKKDEVGFVFMDDVHERFYKGDLEFLLKESDSLTIEELNEMVDNDKLIHLEPTEEELQLYNLHRKLRKI